MLYIWCITIFIVLFIIFGVFMASFEILGWLTD
jgi:hypothetical protein